VKKFVLLAHGDMEQSPEFRDAHMKWWSSLQDHVVDSGNPLFNGRTVSKDGTVTEVTLEMTPALGYSIVQAESIDDAVALLAGCPMDMWVYEAMPM
jgi:hypothetical protein